MANKNSHHLSNSLFLTNHFYFDIKNSSKQFPLHSSTSSLDRSKKSYNDNRLITQPSVNKLLNELVKQEEININKQQLSTEINRNLSIIPMTNTSSHLMPTLNPAHLPDGAESYFVSGLTDLASNFKLNPSSNTDIPSPSSSSNSSNPPSSSHHHHHHHHQHHPPRRHGEGGDPTRKREMRLQKNREAARECRRKKKEYIKCLEERVAGLENQNKALIEELRQLKELYCQREDPNKKK